MRTIAAPMRQRDVGLIVLLEDGRPVGFVTDRNRTISALAERREPAGPAA